MPKGLAYEMCGEKEYMGKKKKKTIQEDQDKTYEVEDVEKLELSHIAGKNAKWYTYYETQFGSFCKS